MSLILNLKFSYQLKKRLKFVDGIIKSTINTNDSFLKFPCCDSVAKLPDKTDITKTAIRTEPKGDTTPKREADAVQRRLLVAIKIQSLVRLFKRKIMYRKLKFASIAI